MTLPSAAGGLGRWIGVAGGAAALCALLAGCGGGPISTPASGVGCSVTVQIPAQGSGLLGQVVATYDGHKTLLSRNTDTVPVACGEHATLTARALHASSNPFQEWTYAGRTSSSSSVNILVDGLVTATPHFRVPVVKPSPSPSPSPTLTPVPSPTPSVVTLDKFVSYDPITKTVTWSLVAAYHDVNHGLSFDGYSSGGMTVSVPRGWVVTVNFSNVGTLNHSAAVVTDTGTTPVFPGAAVSNLSTGIPPGGTDTFSFTPDTIGNYRMACLMPGHEQAGMWVSFDVTSSGLPKVRT